MGEQTIDHQPIPAPRRRGPLDWLLIAATVVAIGGVAFAVGRVTAPAAASTAQVPTFVGGPAFGPGASLEPGASFVPGGPGGPQGGAIGVLGGGSAGLTIQGSVTAFDGTSLTLETASGQSIVLTIDDATTFHEATEADGSAVAVGDDVAVRVGGGFQRGGPGAAPSDAPAMSATDVTVER